MYCPNCGGEMTGNRCPYCGSQFSEPAAPGQTGGYRQTEAAQGFAPNRNESEWKDEFQRWDDAELDDNALPVSKFLRKLAKTPLMLFSTILATLYAGGVCYTFGKASIGMTEILVANNFDSSLSNDKIGRTIFLISCFVHICMAIWLVVSMWSLFSSAVSRKKPTFHIGWFNSFHSFASVGQKLYFLLTIFALLTMGLMLFELDLSKPAFYSITMVTSNAATQTGLAHIVPLLFGENVFRAIFFIVVYAFEAIRFSMLVALSTVAGGMLRFDETTYWRLPPIALMTFLSGVLKLGVGIFTLVKLGTSMKLLMLYVPLCILGLTLICCAVLLHRFCVGVKHRQGIGV